MRLRLLTLMTTAALAVAGAAAAGAPVTLRSDLADGDGRVTLGDLFEGAGAAAGLVVAAGPAPGGSVILDARRVQAMAASAGLAWPNAEGHQRLVVRAGPSAGAGRTGSVEVLAWTRNLAAGEIVRPEDVVWTSVQAHLAPPDGPRDPDGVIGKATRRTLRAGAGVSGRDLAAPAVVRTDETINVAYTHGGVTLVLQARALRDAGIGETVQVLNLQSRKTVEAVVSGPGRAVVGPEADSLKARQFALR